MANSDAYIKTYNSFSGIDIKAVFGGKVIGELQAISYSVTREKAGIWTMGSPDPRAYNRGKRGLAGSMIFIVFDRSALLEAMKDTYFLSDNDEGRVFETYNTSGSNMRLSQLDLLTEPQAATLNPAFNDGAADFDQTIRNPFYVDQIPPFDISLVGANEYGALAIKKILGVELLNEGSGFSIDDIVAEEQFTFVARMVTPWLPQKRIEINSKTS
jgi:hypothetical protein